MLAPVSVIGAVAGIIKYPIFIADKSSFASLVKGGDPRVPFSLLVEEKGTLVRALVGWSEGMRLSLEALADGH